jgi:anti-anti-sigma factor
VPLVVDLRGLSFIDSSGLRAVLDGHSGHTSAGVEMNYLQPSGNLWRVFTVTGSDKLLPFDDRLAAAAGAPPSELDS